MAGLAVFFSWRTAKCRRLGIMEATLRWNFPRMVILNSDWLDRHPSARRHLQVSWNFGSPGWLGNRDHQLLDIQPLSWMRGTVGRLSELRGHPATPDESHASWHSETVNVRRKHASTFLDSVADPMVSWSELSRCGCNQSMIRFDCNKWLKPIKLL